MASGDTLCVFSAQANLPPLSNAASYAVRNGRLVLSFDDSTDEAAAFQGILPRHYAGGGLTVTVIWAAATATSDTCRWTAAIERDNADLDLDSDSFAAAQSTGASPSVAAGGVVYTNIAFSDGAAMDNLAAGEAFRLKITRDAEGTSGTDDMAGDALLVAIEIKES